MWLWQQSVYNCLNDFDSKTFMMKTLLKLLTKNCESRLPNSAWIRSKNPIAHSKFIIRKLSLTKNKFQLLRHRMQSSQKTRFLNNDSFMLWNLHILRTAFFGAIEIYPPRGWILKYFSILTWFSLNKFFFRLLEQTEILEHSWKSVL